MTLAADHWRAQHPNVRLGEMVAESRRVIAGATEGYLARCDDLGVTCDSTLGLPVDPRTEASAWLLAVLADASCGCGGSCCH